MRDRTLVAVLGGCLLVATTAYLMVFTLLGQIGQTLGASRTALDWITIATVIVGTVSGALLPALGAVLGERRLMVIAMACLAFGSLLSAVAPDVAVLLAGRIVAAPGLAAAALSIAIVRKRRSGQSLARALGVIAAFEGGAAGTGFALGGIVEEVARADWRAVFLAMAAISAAAALTAAAVVPAGAVAADSVAADSAAAGAVAADPVAVDPADPGNARATGGCPGPGDAEVRRRLDLGGALLLAGGLAAGLLAITEGSTWGWASARIAGLLGGTAALLAVWAVGAVRAADPLLRLRVLGRPGVALGAAFTLVTACTVGIVNLTAPSFLETPPTTGFGDGASVLTAGLDMLPFAAAITLAGYLAGRLAPGLGLRGIGAAGLGAEALGLGLLAWLPHSAGQVVGFLAVVGAGHGSLVAAAYIAITKDVPAYEAGAAAGFGSAVSGISGAVASAVITPVLASRLVLTGSSAVPAASGYTRSWLCGAAFAAAAALIVIMARKAGAGRRPALVQDEAGGIPVDYRSC
jgi:MFS family permease